MLQQMSRDKSRVTALSRDAFDAVLLDLDGVVTDTAALHAAAWKQLFDAYLAERSARNGKRQAPFDTEEDYRTFVDGKPRHEGVRSFLGSRGIELPYGTPDDAPGTETVCGLGNRKDELFHQRLKRDGATPIASSVEFVRKLRSQGFKTAVVSSSRNCAAILDAVGISELFDAQVDGVDAARLGLKGKPHPDTFLDAARRLGVEPARAVVVEDAIAGVQAGRNGRFGCVVGVDRTGHGAALAEKGADVVVTRLSEITVNGGSSSKVAIDDLPSALQHVEDLARTARNKRLVFFLDYDGTLTPIVDRPDLAMLSGDMRAALKNLAERFTVAIISGRDLHDVENLVKVEGIFYAGSHGFRISGPGAFRHVSEHGTEFLPTLDQAEGELHQRIDPIPGALIERKHLSIAVHYRLVGDADVAEVETAVDKVLADHPQLRKSLGKKVFDLQPNIGWNKGRAILWLLEVLHLEQDDDLPLYIGDDVTDEDAFTALRDRGVGIVVKGANRPTAARYALDDPDQVRRFFDELVCATESARR